MKQIIVKIDKDLETGNQQMVISCTEDDNTIRKVINYNQMTEKDTKFISDLEAFELLENYGG